MPDLVTTIRDAVDALIRRMSGERLCALCKQWAKNPHRSGSGEYFCDRIHASVFYKKQEETMRQAMEKKRAAEKPIAQKPKDEKPLKTPE